MNKIGDFKYFTFGLRLEWIELFLKNGIEVLVCSTLGPKQKEALYYYLKDMELIVNRKETTAFYDMVSLIYEKKGIYSVNLWSFLWINLYFNSLLFSWYGTIPLGRHNRKEVLKAMTDSYKKINTSVISGYTSLVGTLEKTPIGKELRIGMVVKEGAQRTTYKEGNFKFHPVVVLYTLYKYIENEKNLRNSKIELKMIEEMTYSPQKVLVLSSEQVKNSILSLYEPEFFSVISSEDKFIIELNPNKKALDIINLFLRREKII